MCHSFAAQNKTQNLQLEKIGASTTDVNSRFQESQNHFCLVTAPDASYSKPIEELHKFSVEDMMAEIKAKILERSAGGIKGIGRIFRAMDDAGDRNLDVDDFRWGLIDYGITLTKEEAQTVLNLMDRDKNGKVNYDEFLRYLKGDLNEARTALIRQAYDKLDANKNGTVQLDDIAALYDATQHPDVIMQRKTAEEVFTDFMQQWDLNADGNVTFEEFCDYFAGVSSSIDRDDYFEAMMKSSWKL